MSIEKTKHLNIYICKWQGSPAFAADSEGELCFINHDAKPAAVGSVQCNWPESV